jgi:hypothetical protein
MHFCPRPKCSKWFHETCLLSRGHTDKIEYAGSAELRRLAVDPDLDKPHDKLEKFLWTKPARGKMSATEQPSAYDMLVEMFPPGDGPDLPRSLVEIAMMPIVRRAGHDGFSTAGNVQDVVLARKMVYQRLDGGFKDLDRLMQQLPENWWLNEGRAYHLVWTNLSTQRILAVPRAAYWDARSLELGVHGPRPCVYCPDCTAKGEYHVAI